MKKVETSELVRGAQREIARVLNISTHTVCVALRYENDTPTFRLVWKEAKKKKYLRKV